VIGPVPAGVARSPELAESERPQAGGSVVIAAQVADNDEFDRLLRRYVVLRVEYGCVDRVWFTHSGAS
jgi:hypothetical protein